jgi:hypothetical protein
VVARPIRSAEYWKEVIRDFLKSGLSQQKYEQKHKICRVTLRAWSKRLGIPISQRRRTPKVGEEPSLSFIEVCPIEKGRPFSSLLKLEITFPQGHSLKLETEGAWDQAGSFIKALVR